MDTSRFPQPRIKKTPIADASLHPTIGVKDGHFQGGCLSSHPPTAARRATPDQIVLEQRSRLLCLNGGAPSDPRPNPDDPSIPQGAKMEKRPDRRLPALASARGLARYTSRRLPSRPFAGFNFFLLAAFLFGLAGLALSAARFLALARRACSSRSRLLTQLEGADDSADFPDAETHVVELHRFLGIQNRLFRPGRGEIGFQQRIGRLVQFAPATRPIAT